MVVACTGSYLLVPLRLVRKALTLLIQAQLGRDRTVLIMVHCHDEAFVAIVVILKVRRTHWQEGLLIAITALIQMSWPEQAPDSVYAW